MNQEKFVKNYIDLLNRTLTEAIQKNLTILAEKNVFENELNEIKERNDNSLSSLQNTLLEREKLINDLKSQLNDARKQKEISVGGNNELKKNVQHFDTFKNELVKTRTEIEKLQKQLTQQEEKNKELLLENEKLKQENSNLLEESKSKNDIFVVPTEQNTSKKTKTNLRKLMEKNVDETPLFKDAGNF